MLAMHASPGNVVRLLDSSEAAIETSTKPIRQHVKNGVHGILGRSESVSLDLSPIRSTHFMHIDGDHGLWALHNDLDIADRVMGSDRVVVIDDFPVPHFIGVNWRH